MFVNTTPKIEPATEIPIVMAAFLVTIAMAKKIIATAQYKGKERIRLFTAYAVRSGMGIPVFNTGNETITETTIYEIMIAVHPRI